MNVTSEAVPFGCHLEREPRTACAALARSPGDAIIHSAFPRDGARAGRCASFTAIDRATQIYAPGDRLLVTRQVCEILGCGKTKIYEILNSDEESYRAFPRPRHLGASGRNLWLESEVRSWIATHLVCAEPSKQAAALRAQ